MFDWLKKLFGASPQSAPTVASSSPAPTPEPVDAPFDAVATIGRWIELHPRWEHPEPFIGYVYMDRDAGLSAKGDRKGAGDIANAPGFTLRLPMAGAWHVLSEGEIAAHMLPEAPEWLVHYGPQPGLREPWREDPIVRSHTHPRFPDDVEVLVHDGEPRRTGRKPEKCWVRVLRAESLPPSPVVYDAESAMTDPEAFEARYGRPRFVYTGKLLNKPHHLTTVRAGDELQFVPAEGVDMPLMVTPQYLAERARWRVRPCNGCGMAECWDPPSVMARTRFPDAPADSVVEAFSAFCVRCGNAGMQLLSLPQE